jgi:pimeloyl-ACP methyl ester carboxylesterase
MMLHHNFSHHRGCCVECLARHALRFAAIAGACVSLATNAAAQVQPTVFIHGLFSTGGVWQQTANTLAQRFQLSPILPTLGWQNSFGTQATNLQSTLSSVSGIPALAWSNGGLVARQYLKQYGSTSRINRVLSIGTPHRGALLAEEAINGGLVTYAGEVYSSIADPINFFYFNDLNFQQAWDQGFLSLLEFAALNMGFVVQNYGRIINITGVPVPGLTNAAVLQQMPPGSAFITALNTSSNLSAESVHTLSRISVATGISPQNAFFALFSSNPAAWGKVRVGLEYAALLMYEQYSTSDDLFLRANAGRWLPLFFYMADFDVQWQAFIGALEGFQGPFAIVDQQDGLVTMTSATWPGANSQINLQYPAHSVPHGIQIFHPDVVAVMQSVLQFNFGVPLRPPPPPPPPGGGGSGCIPPPGQFICDVDGL